MPTDPAARALDPFCATVRTWFAERLGTPTRPQVEGWQHIRSGAHTLIAAPTGSGKTLAAFLHALDTLLRGGAADDRTSVLYVSPLKALGNDVRKNLEGPLQELRERDSSLPEVRVVVRSGDTTAQQRSTMSRRVPHILVTTPESLYILLTSAGGRRMLETVETVIVDEIHAVLGSKRGSHLALSLERLAALCRSGPRATEPQRIGLSATQRPLEDVGRFLVGVDRSCALVDAGHLRALDLAIEVPPSPLSAVCSHEVWEEIYQRMVELIQTHRTTLVFANTRKLTERIAARLSDVLGADRVTSHHGSLAKERRLDAEQRLKDGQLAALVATASLELGIDIGDVDLVIQVGATHSIANLLQRIGRAGHGVGRLPKGRLFPMTTDELVACAALQRAVRTGVLDRTPQPGRPLDILAQQVVAACVAEPQDADALFAQLRRAWPYRELQRAEFDETVALHTAGRHALLHVDGVGGRLLATKRARIPALTSGGAIPDTADYKVVLEPEGTHVGSVHEDFAIEASAGDIFQLGNSSWQILQVAQGVVRVADAAGTPPTLPFWIGEAPSRSRELATAVSEIRSRGEDPAWLVGEVGLVPAAAEAIAEYLAATRTALGTVPTTDCVVLERFFDETGGMQLVLHMPFGSRINRAFGLALRKRFCRGFGFELQAAANEEAIVLSLGPMHSFELAEVFDYLRPDTARDLLVQALLPAPMFQTRWRWNVTRSLVVPRSQGGRRVPSPLLRMRADDALAAAFPQVVACGETLPPGDLPVPMEHPLVRQTIGDCLHEAMDIDGFLALLHGLRDGSIARVAVDTPEPSPMCQGILNAMPFAFLDDAPLEERRTQAVLRRRGADVRTQDELGALDDAAVARVRAEAWPDPQDAEEVHEALLWMGFVADDEAAASGWSRWLDELAAARRVVRDGDRWFAVEASRDPEVVLRGRMEALGPVVSDDPLMVTLESKGHVLRVRIGGTQAFCDRRLLARIHRYTVERLRAEIEPVTVACYLRFLACWQHVDARHRLEGPHGTLQVIGQLAGFELPASAWESRILNARVTDYRQAMLDQLTLGGEVVWGRLWGQGAAPARSTPLCLVPRSELSEFLALAGPAEVPQLSGPAATLLELLTARGATFPQELSKASGLLPSYFEQGLCELIGHGLIQCDSFAALRQFFRAPARRQAPVLAVGRWTTFRRASADLASPAADLVEFVARLYLRRFGVVVRRVLQRERIKTPWRDLVRAYRRLELRGEVRGGRFVAGCDGEQFALDEAVALLRKVRRGDATPLRVAAADPLNLAGILTPDPRIAPHTHAFVDVV
ncbi:MAG: DEAD/DEAH box helicase [Planctomycetes bacterium]|nr:DEAD/DEAH box helicase [Planctomycetota bacterium]